MSQMHHHNDRMQERIIELEAQVAALKEKCRAIQDILEWTPADDRNMDLLVENANLKAEVERLRGEYVDPEICRLREALEFAMDWMYHTVGCDMKDDCSCGRNRAFHKARRALSGGEREDFEAMADRAERAERERKRKGQDRGRIVMGKDEPRDGGERETMEDIIGKHGSRVRNGWLIPDGAMDDLKKEVEESESREAEGNRCALDDNGCQHADRPQDMVCHQQNCPDKRRRQNDAWWEGHPGKFNGEAEGDAPITHGKIPRPQRESKTPNVCDDCSSGPNCNDSGCEYRNEE